MSNTGGNLGDLKLVVVGSTALAGLLAYLVYKRFSQQKIKHFNYPIEIDLNDRELRRLYEEMTTNGNHEPFLRAIKQRYPNECSFSVNSEKKIVFLNSIEAVKQFSANSENIPDRAKNFVFDTLSDHYLGSFFRQSDARLREVRKSSLVGLHKLVDLPSFETNLVDELQHFVDFLNKNELIDNANIQFQQLSTNLIVQIGLGVRFDYDLDANAAAKQQINNMADLLSSLNMIQIEQFDPSASSSKPILDFIVPRLTGLNNFLKGAVKNYVENEYDASVLNTFADFVIGKQKEKMEKQGGKIDDLDNYSDRDIHLQVLTLFMAGAATTGFTLAWAFYYLARDPVLQDRIYQEIESKLGTNSFVYPKSKGTLTFTEATCNEILRLASTVALIPRSTQQDTRVNEYTLAKDTSVLINLYGLHHDEKYWTNSDELKPERWLSGENKLSSFMESFLPFGTAPRTCLGDNLSRLILFLTVANLVQRFKFEYVKGESEKHKLGVMRRPVSYTLKIVPRN